MRKVILPLLLAVSPVAAQPVTQPSTCEVTISRAPDDVRDAIEAWVAAEPRCATTLDVRVIPTDGGYYLFARDPAGRVRERVVPDAQSAGVLVASWVADDLIERHAAEPAPAPVSAPAPTPSPALAPVAPILAPPGAAVPTVPPHVDAGVAPDRLAAGRWLTLGGIVQMHGQGAAGLRAELDLVRRGRWALGAVLAGSAAQLEIAGNTLASGYIETVDVRLLAQLVRTTAIGRRWDLRLAFGAGVMHTRATGELDAQPIEAAGVFPTAEASVLFGRELGRGGWAIAFGPVVTWYSQTYKFEDDFGSMLTLQRRDLEIMAFGGLRRRL